MEERDDIEGKSFDVIWDYLVGRICSPAGSGSSAVVARTDWTRRVMVTGAKERSTGNVMTNGEAS